MLSNRCQSAVLLFSAITFSLTVFAQGPGSTGADDFFVHHKHASIIQSTDAEFGSAVAMGGDVLLSADLSENIEILRLQPDGSWSFEAALTAPEAGIAFGSRHAMATNGAWIAVGAKLDDAYGSNSGAVHMYKFDGADWDYRGSLSHMTPHGSIVTDQFGMALAMDGDRMVVGSRAENGVGAAGAVHYFTYNSMLDMWIESGFIASEHTSGNSTSKFGESVDISGDWMIVGEHRNNTNGQFAGAAYIYHFTNQCWHLSETFYGDATDNKLGYDVAISGTNAVAGAPFADTDGLNESGAAKLYQLVPFSGDESFWAETFDITAPTPVQGDWFGLSIDIDGDLLLVGAPRDDDDVINGGVGYFMFDCSTDNYDCVAEGLACDAMQNDRLGIDVALSGELAVIGAPLDDNIFEDAGSAYVLGMNDIGFECDLTAPGAPSVDLVDENDTGALNDDDITRHTTPDFDIYLPGGGAFSVASGFMAGAGDALVWTLDGTSESEMVILTQDDIDNGYVTMQFVYPGPVLPDGEYTFCASITDVFGNTGDAGCLTVTIDNEDPLPAFENGAEYDTSNTDTYGAYLPGASDPADCEALAAASGGTWAGIINDAEANMVTPGCYITGGNPFQASTYEWQALATILPDTTLYLDAAGSASLDLSSADNITATDNIAMDTLFAEPITFDCDDAGTLVPVTLTAIDIAGNIATMTVQVEVLDTIDPVAVAQDITVQLDSSGSASIAASDIDNGSSDNCSIVSMSLDITSFDCDDLGSNTVVLTVTDPSGNSHTASATVTVEDNIAPTAIAQDFTVQLDASGMASIAASDIDNGSTDNCTITDRALDITSFDCDDLGTNMVVLTITDQSGNFSTATATVTVQDNLAPTALAQGLTVELDAAGTASIALADIDNGSTDNCTITSSTLDITSFDCDDLGANTVTLTITDQSGNTSAATATVTVEDNLAPTAMAQNLTVQLDASGAGSITAAQVDNGSSDNCTISSLALDITDFGCADVGTNTVILTATDPSSNSSTATATITVEDNIAPTAIAQDITVVLDAAGAASIVASDIDNGSYDACGVTLSADITSFDCDDLGANTVTLTVTDPSSNSSTATATVTVQDNEAPAISGTPADISQTNDAGDCGAIITWTAPTASDNCSATLTSDHSSGDSFPVGATLVTYTAVDPAGNTTTSSFTVTVTDDEDPTITGLADINQTADAGQCGAVVSWTAPSIEDNCGVNATTNSHNSGDTFPVGSTVVTYTATDAAGNGASVTFTVTVTDDEAPAITGMPADIALDNEAGLCTAVATWTAPAATDNCGMDSFTSSHNSGDTFSVGSTTVSYTATDIHGNDSIASFTVTVNDAEAPVIGFIYTEDFEGETPYDANDLCATDNIYTPDDANWSLGPACTVPTNGIPKLVDVAGDTFLEYNQKYPTNSEVWNSASIDVAGMNEVTVSFDARSVGGLESYGPYVDDFALYAVLDGVEEATPIVAFSGHVDGTGDSPGDNSRMEEASFSETVTLGGASGLSLRIRVTISGSDGSESYQVDDMLIHYVPGNMTASNDAGVCGAVVTWTAPVASDNCGMTLTSSHDSGDTFTVGTTTVTYTATDDAGNTDETSFDITVTDDEDPTVDNTPADISANTDAGSCGAVINWTAPTAGDNCAGATIAQTGGDASGSTFAVGTHTIEYTATDAAGNTATDSFTITVTDNENPAISGMPANITQTNDAGDCGALVSWTAPTATDNCTVTSFTSDHNSGDSFAVGTTTVTYTAMDAAGNTSTGSFTVTVTDDEDPAIADMPANISQTNDAGDCSALVSWSAPTSSDNCGVPSFTSSHNSGDSFAVGATTVTYTSMDAAGNTTTASFTVTVTDDEDPTVDNTPADISVDNDAGACGALVTWTAPTTSDNCAGATIAQTGGDSSGSSFAVGTHTIEYTATDASGNTATDSFTITVTDDEDPSISGMPADINQTADAGLCSAVITWTAPTAGDNCAVDTFTSSHNSGDAFSVGTTTVIYTATDVNGNSSTSSFDIVVTDDEDPVISGTPADISQTNDAGECEAAVTWTEPTAADNCAIASFTSSHNPGDEFNVGTTTVTYTATDIHGNSSTDSFEVEVTDDEAPTISGMPANISQTNDAGECAADVSWSAPTADDNCGVASFTSSHDSGDSFDVGTTTVTYSVTDIHGNSNSASFTVTVTDDENPVISPMAADQTYQRDGGEAAAFSSWLANYGGAAATDNCGIDSWSDNSTGLSDGCGSTGTETVTFTVTDIHSNSSTTTATFTVIDDFAPSCPTIDLVLGNDDGPDLTDNITNDTEPTIRVMFTGTGVESAEAGDEVELYIDGDLFATSSVSQQDVDNGYAEFQTGPFADGPVSWSARHIDGCDQASIFAFLNIIVNTTDPTLSLQPVTVTLDEDGHAAVPVGDFVVDSSDDLGFVDISAAGNPEVYVVEESNGSLWMVNLETSEAEMFDISHLEEELGDAAEIMMYDAAAGGFVFSTGEGFAVTNDEFEILYSGDFEDSDLADGSLSLDCVTAADQAGGWIYAIERNDCTIEDSLQFFRFRFEGLGEIEAELLHVVSDNVNGGEHDFDGMAVDLESGFAYLVGDADATGSGNANEELWLLDIATGDLLWLGDLDEDTEAMWFDNGQLWLGQDDGEIGIPTFAPLPDSTPYDCADASCAIPDTVQFSKADFADLDDELLWDHITESVALYRGEAGGIYNALGGGGIYFKWGPTAVGGGYTSNFQAATDWNANDLPGETLSLYIPEGNLFFDLEFSDWTCCQEGGGFAYQRVHVEAPSLVVGKFDDDDEYLDLDDIVPAYGNWDIEAAYFGRIFTNSVMLDCGDTDAPVEVVIRAEDIAGNVVFDTTYATVIDDMAPTLELEPHTVYLNIGGEGYISPSDVLGAATMDNCSYSTDLSWGGQSCDAVSKYDLTSGTLDQNTSNCDDCTTLVPLGFDFTFYGQTYSQVYISSNGLLQFESNSSECCSGEAIPDSDYEAAIAVIHTDLDPDERDDSKIYYQTVGTAPNREFVVSWSQVANYEDNDVRHDGQAVLYEATGQVDIFSGYHGDLPDDCDDPMTTGISNQDGTLGMAPLQFVENCSERGNLYIEFTPDGDNYAMEYEVCSDFTCADVGVIDVTVTVTDPSGNATSGVVEVTVVDEVAPVVASTPYIQSLDENGVATYDLSNATATDACGIQSFEAINTLDCDVEAPATGSVDFEKLDGTSGAEATDVISWDVALTRGNNGGLYNAILQNGYDQNGPEGTLWKLGTAGSNSVWTSLYDAVGGSLGNNLPGETLTMVTLQSQRFFEITFTGWTQGGNGGGFSYTRTEVPTASGFFADMEAGEGCEGFVSETLSFEKMDYDDPTLVYDSIAPGIWISRGEEQGLINASTGESFWDNEGPSGTLWRIAGSGAAWSSFYDAFGGGIGNQILATDLEMFVPSVDQIWMMDFTSWTSGGNGGGFAYTRTSLAPCAGCTSPVAFDYSQVAIFPTPCDIPVYEEVQLVATDIHGNVTEHTAYMAVVDDMAPTLNIFDLEDYTLYAGESCVDDVDLFAAGYPWYEATDNCGAEVNILYDEINETGIAGCREFDRRWIIQAVDASGNMASDTTLQHITVIDTTAPTLFLDGVPADLSIDLAADCTGDMPAAASVTASATDNCTDAPTLNAVTMTDSAPEYLCGDAGSYTVTRTYSATAEDACGNMGTISVEQVVTFLDVTAPQITDSEGIANGETVSEADADDIFAFIDVPSPIDLDAEDACGGDVTIVETETFSGFVPTEEIGNYCGAATPSAFLDGEACNGDAPAAIVLEGAYFGGESFTIADGGVNIVESFFDQTLHIEVEVTNADGTGGFIWNADYNEALNWAQWNSLGRGYKKDCANVLPGSSPWTGWDYFVMQTGGMIGTGIYAGSELSLTHQPMNYYYGLQVGQGANNQNAKYGASAWFFWSGQLVVNGASQGFLASSGDIMLDLDCTMPWSAEYAYTVSDACGNTTSFSYTVEGDESNAGGAYVSGEESGHQPFDISVIGDLKDPIRVTGLMPNPTNDVSQLGFVVSNNMRLRVDLYSMDGQLVQELYDGNAMTDVEYLMTIDADGLDAGMYQIRIASSTYMAVKKLLVTQ